MTGPPRRVRAGMPARSPWPGPSPSVAISPDELDADPFLLNCPNGTLDLRTGELRGHDPADLLTKITRAAYHPDAASADGMRSWPRSSPTRRCAATWPGSSALRWKAR